jgi:hypothetical protein
MSLVSHREMLNDVDNQNAALLADVNTASAAARNTWVLFMAVLAYFFITLAGVTHLDLLLAKPVVLPILQVEIGLRAYFTYAPVVLLVMHFNLLLQHAILTRKLREFHERVARREDAHFRDHRLRVQLHSYFYVQAIAGPSRSALFSAFLHTMSGVTLWLLPLTLLLFFQIAFLPFHDQAITTAHRAYVLIDFIIFAVFGIFLRFPGLSYIIGLGRNIITYPLSFLGMMTIWVCAMFFSFAIATIPDEGADRAMRSISSLAAPVPFGSEPATAQRSAFLPTAFLFEGQVDLISGRNTSWFARNLVVTDTDLTQDPSVPAQGTSIRLRVRDFRYATFDRSDFSRADLTGADLSRASLRATNFTQSRLIAANLVGADMTGARLEGAELTGADLRSAIMQGVDLSQTVGDYLR